MNQNELYHHGIKGMHWGIRRYQNPDGTLTAKGKQRYGTVENFNAARAQRRKNIVKGAAIGAGIAGAGLAAYYGGKAAWKNPAIRDKLTNMYTKANNAVGDAKDWANNTVGNAKDWARRQVRQGQMTYKYGTDFAGNGVGETVGRAARNVTNAAGKAAGAVTKAVGDAKDWTNNAVGDAKNWARRQVRQGQLTYKYGTDFAGNGVGETVGRAARNVTTAAGKAAGAVSKAAGDAKNWAGETYAKAARTAGYVKKGISSGYNNGNIPKEVMQRYSGLGAGAAIGRAARGTVGAAQTAYRATGKAAKAAGQWAYANRGNIARGAGVVAGGTALGAGVGAIARNNPNRKKKK